MDFGVLSKYRNQIYGVSALWIMLFHFWGFGFIPCEDQGIARALLSNGRIGVDIFLFLSGMSLYFSYHKRPDARTFYSRRLLRLLVPVYLISVPRWIHEYLVLTWKPDEFVMSASLLKLFVVGDNTVWFVSFILLCYVMYPVIYEVAIRDRTHRQRMVEMLALCAFALLWFWLLHGHSIAIFTRYEIWVGRVPSFLLGCAVGPLVYERKRLPVPLVVCSCVVALGYLAMFEQWLMPRWWWRASLAPCGAAIAIVLGVLCMAADKAFSGRGAVLKALGSLGGVSLELYLTHICARYVVWRCIGVPEQFYPMLGLPLVVASIAMAYSLRWLSNRIQEGRLREG